MYYSYKNTQTLIILPAFNFIAPAESWFGICFRVPMISNTSSPQLAPKPITFVSCRGETQLGMCITEAVRVLLSSPSSRRTSIVDVKRVLTHFDFHLNAFLITLFPNVISQCKFCKNGFFLVLSSSFHIHAISKLAPVLSQKSEKMHLVRTSWSSIAKMRTVTPIFYFMILIRTVLPFDEKKIGTNLCSVFGNFTKLYGLSYHGSNSACPI